MGRLGEGLGGDLASQRDGSSGEEESALFFGDTLSWRCLQVSGEDTSTRLQWGGGRGAGLGIVGIIKLCFWNFTLSGKDGC